MYAYRAQIEVTHGHLLAVRHGGDGGNEVW